MMSDIKTLDTFVIIHDILDAANYDDMCKKLSNLHLELARKYYKDTGNKIGPQANYGEAIGALKKWQL